MGNANDARRSSILDGRMDVHMNDSMKLNLVHNSSTNQAYGVPFFLGCARSYTHGQALEVTAKW
jgi:hypothetical protein